VHTKSLRNEKIVLKIIDQGRVQLHERPGIELRTRKTHRFCDCIYVHKVRACYKRKASQPHPRLAAQKGTTRSSTEEL
jgi:hypothetical protein